MSARRKIGLVLHGLASKIDGLAWWVEKPWAERVLRSKHDTPWQAEHRWPERIQRILREDDQ